MNNKNIKNLLDNVEKYAENRGFTNRHSPGLLDPRFNYPFSPSAGHHIIDDVVISNPNPEPVFKFSVIPDRSIRMYDAEKIGISSRHLSFFETMLLGYAGATEELPKEEACIELFNLFQYLNLDPNKLIVTCLDYVEAEGKKFDSEKSELLYKSWKNLLGSEKVKKTRGRRNLFYAHVIGNPGGIGCELYYPIGKEIIEIGSQVNYQFKYTGSLEKTRNQAILQGFGLERLLMVLEDKEKISDVSLVAPIKKVVRDYLKSHNEDDTTIDLYDESLTKIADSIRAIMFIMHDCSEDTRQLRNSQRKILNKFKNNLNSKKSEFNYLGIYDPKIYEDLVDVTVEIFKDRYPNMPKIKGNVLGFIRT